MKPIWSKEPKKYRIRKGGGGAPPNVGGLSCSALVVMSADLYGIPILFEESMVEAIGQHMQYGISRMTPAYLCASRIKKGYWEVWSRYFGVYRNTDVLLWVSSSKPKWLRGVKNESKEKGGVAYNKRNGENCKQTPRSGEGGCVRCATKCSGGPGCTPGDGDHCAVPGTN